jgi:hypothetical protein
MRRRVVALLALLVVCSLATLPAASVGGASPSVKRFWRGTIEIAITESGRNPEGAGPEGLEFHANWTFRWRFRERPPRRNIPDTGLDFVVAAGRGTAFFKRRDVLPDPSAPCLLGRFAEKRFEFRDLLSFQGYPVRRGVSLSLGEVEPPVRGFEQRRSRSVIGIDRTVACDFTEQWIEDVRIPKWLYLAPGKFRGGPKKSFLRGSATTKSRCRDLPAPWQPCGEDPNFYKTWTYRVRVDLRRVT